MASRETFTCHVLQCEIYKSNLKFRLESTKNENENLENEVCFLRSSLESMQQELEKKVIDLEKYKKWYKKANEQFLVQRETSKVEVTQKEITVANLKKNLEEETKRYETVLQFYKLVSAKLGGSVKREVEGFEEEEKKHLCVSKNCKINKLYLKRCQRSLKSDNMLLSIQAENWKTDYELKVNELEDREKELQKFVKFYNKANEQFLLERNRNKIEIKQKDLTIKNLKQTIEEETKRCETTLQDFNESNAQMKKLRREKTEITKLKTRLNYHTFFNNFFICLVVLYFTSKYLDISYF